MGAVRTYFYSRPRAGAIRGQIRDLRLDVGISTHAPVRGRSSMSVDVSECQYYFYSRPRAGAISTPSIFTSRQTDFYSRPRAGAIFAAEVVRFLRQISTHAPVRGRSLFGGMSGNPPR